MTFRPFHRRVLPLLLCAGLLTLWASSAPAQKARASQSTAPATSGLLDQAWRFLQNLWADTGCRIDPDGRCLTGTTQAPTLRHLWGAEGCRIDPNGHCVTGTAQVPQTRPDTDTGCRIDPSGICRN